MIDLTKKSLPNTVEVDGRLYSVYTDFRVWMKFEIALAASHGREPIPIDYLFKNERPIYCDVRELLKFSRPARELPRKVSGTASDDVIVIDFRIDADLIYAAFLQQYRIDLTEVEELQRLKTGALIRAAVEMGCAVAGGAEEQREALCRYADCLGLAFQIQDDILDVVGDEATLGKPIGSDVRSDKTTFVALKGLADCRILVAELTDRAVEALAPFGSEAESLRGLAQSLAGREK